jgi:hypothetical protein
MRTLVAGILLAAVVRPTVAADTPPNMESAHDAARRIIAVLDEPRLWQRTIAIFTSDNGGLLGSTDSSPLRSGKGFPYAGGKRELYNLANDLGEKHDLAARMPEKARQLDAKLTAWLASVGAKLPRPNPSYRGRKASSGGQARVAKTPRID